MTSQDIFKWVDFTGTDVSDYDTEICSTDAHDGKIFNITALNSTHGVADVLINTHSENAVLGLCYRFGDSDFRFYRDIVVLPATVQYFATPAGSSDTAVANNRKTLSLHGVGLSPNDIVKFVLNDTSCEDDYSGVTVEEYVPWLVPVFYSFQRTSSSSTEQHLLREVNASTSKFFNALHVADKGGGDYEIDVTFPNSTVSSTNSGKRALVHAICPPSSPMPALTAS